MARKPVKVYLSRKQWEILSVICERLGMKESEVMRQAFMEYAKDISMISEEIHGNHRQR